MNIHSKRERLTAKSRISAVLFMTALAAALVGQDAAVHTNMDNEVVVRSSPASPRQFVFIPGLKRTATLYATGRAIATEWETLWRPMCGSKGDRMTKGTLMQIAESMAKKLTPMEPDGGADDDDGGIAGGGLDLIITTDGSVPGPAIAAIAQAKAYVESQFSDPISVHVFLSFESMPPDTLGATGLEYTKIPWPTSREGLQDGMDGSDNILNYLPTGSTIKVRYDGDTDEITNETRVYWTKANFKATIGAVSGESASMSFNDNIPWDYDPSNGVVGVSFQDVLIHEIGHALGFTSGADFRFEDMEALDIFRFQRTGGGHDYNPDTTAEFKVRPRLVSYNSPNNDVVCDVINQEYRMSDGNPYQCSHFREQDDNIGLMDPALADGETHYPDFYSNADLRMFDAIGYDR